VCLITHGLVTLSNHSGDNMQKGKLMARF